MATTHRRCSLPRRRTRATSDTSSTSPSSPFRTQPPPTAWLGSQRGAFGGLQNVLADALICHGEVRLCRQASPGGFGLADREPGPVAATKGVADPAAAPGADRRAWSTRKRHPRAKPKWVEAACRLGQWVLADLGSGYKSDPPDLSGRSSQSVNAGCGLSGMRAGSSLVLKLMTVG
jgi:hypothetical protein